MRHQLTVADAMVMVAAAAIEFWGAISYKSGIPLSFVDRPGLPLFPLLVSVPVAAAFTWLFLAVPVRTLGKRARQIRLQPGTARAPPLPPRLSQW